MATPRPPKEEAFLYVSAERRSELLVNTELAVLRKNSIRPAFLIGAEASQRRSALRECLCSAEMPSGLGGALLQRVQCFR